MKGKAKQKKKIGSIILIGMGFFLTAILTFTSTLAWFYDSDWASKYINMAGTVGIEIRDYNNNPTSGSGNLYFKLYNEDPNDPASNPLAYPGQSIDVSASVHNTGGRSGSNGSACYVRAHFAVYTDIGRMPDPNNYPGKETDPQYLADKAIAEQEEALNARNFYNFLQGLITKENTENTSGYHWVYHRHEGRLPLSSTGTSGGTINYYLEGEKHTDENSTAKDKGYFYLCYDGSDAANGFTDEVLKPLGVNDDAVFLWNDTFIIPWQLTNESAGKKIFVAVTFQAIQTFIPKMETGGIINSDPNNQLPASSCTYNSTSVQTVFNSCKFKVIDTKIDGIDFGNGPYDNVSTPSTPPAS